MIGPYAFIFTILSLQPTFWSRCRSGYPYLLFSLLHGGVICYAATRSRVLPLPETRGQIACYSGRFKVGYAPFSPSWDSRKDPPSLSNSWYNDAVPIFTHCADLTSSGKYVLAQSKQYGMRILAFHPVTVP